MINYYYCASDIALETDIHGIQTVKRASQPVTLTPVRTHIIDFLLKYPKASFDEIVAALAMMTGKPPVPASVASDLEELGRMHLIACQTLPPRLNMPYPIDHTCECCGCSCLAQLVGPLTDNEHANILDAHQDLAASGAVPADVNPIMKGLKPDGTCLHFLNFPGKRCFFLGDDNLCKIHGKFGAMKKPAACRRFPLIAIRTESEIRIGIKPYCYANMRVCKLEPAASDALAWYEAAQSMPNTTHLDAQHREMKIMLDDLIENAAFRPVIRVPDPDEALQASLQETQILSWLQSPIPFAGLLASLMQGAPSKLETFPKPFIQDVQRAFKTLAGMLKTEADKLGTTPHAKHAHDLCALLEKTLTNFDCLTPEHKFGKYVRIALFEAVFLRETSRFPAVSLGTFALALGALAAAQDSNNADTHFTAWMRLFAQTQAFSMLFPTPQAMAALARHL